MLKSFDGRRDLFFAKNTQDAIDFSVQHWIDRAKQAIQQRGRFAVALSGGSTPKAIYQALSFMKNAIDWGSVWLFWSDERAVPPNHQESNYHMAMEHFSKLPIPAHQIFRMKAEKDLEKHALEYQERIMHDLGSHLFDLVMLGVGEDGHTASLFPNTVGLNVEDRLVIINHVPQLKTERMTLTFKCINQSATIAIYALGPSKKIIVPKVLNAPIKSVYPASRIGTPEHKALWILDSVNLSQ